MDLDSSSHCPSRDPRLHLTEFESLGVMKPGPPLQGTTDVRMTKWRSFLSFLLS